MNNNKLYDKVKSFIKNNYVFLLVLALIIFLFNYKLDYEIYTYGTPLKLDSRIVVDTDNESKGKFYLTYVEARPGILPFILLSKIIPSWDLMSLDNSRIENESAEDIQERGKIDLYTVNDYAIKNAFDEANVPYIINNKEIVVYYIFESADTELRIGDVIKSVDNINVYETEDLTSYIQTKNIGDKVSFIVLRDGKEKVCYGIVSEEENKKLIGVYLVSNINITPSVDVNFKYKSSESGPSGGLMSTLEIYDKLVEEDITKGLKIAGTGTIDYEGNVGPIGGVKYKLMGAVKNKMDVFIAPTGENYEEAKEIIEENNYKIKLIEAKDFKQVLEELKKL